MIKNKKNNYAIQYPYYNVWCSCFSTYSNGEICYMLQQTILFHNSVQDILHEILWVLGFHIVFEQLPCRIQLFRLSFVINGSWWTVAFSWQMWAMSHKSFVNIPYSLLLECVKHPSLTVDRSVNYPLKNWINCLHHLFLEYWCSCFLLQWDASFWCTFNMDWC